MLSSFIPRPFPSPVFDRSQYAKTEGKGLEERVTCMTSGVDMREDRGGVVPDEGPSCNILFKNLRLQRRKTASIQLIIQKI